MKKIFLIPILSFVLLRESPAQGTWIQKADFAGAPRFVAAAFSIGTKGYIGTGRDAGGGFTKDFWEWDQSNNVWTQKADFGGTERMAAAGFSIGDKGYIATGWNINLVFTQDLWEYDPANNNWTQKADLPGAGRYRATGFSIGTKGYIATGYDGITYFNDLWEWDQTANTWSQKANFPGAARLSPVSFSIDSKGYMGTGGDGNFVANYNDFYEWDQSTNTWTQKANFPGAARMGASGFAISCKGYVGTGVGSGGSSYSDFWEYAPSTDSWSQQTDFGGGTEAQGCGFSIGDKGYIGEGQNMNNGFWEFTPDSLCVLNAPAFSVVDTTLCEKFCTAFVDQSTNNPTSWQWSFPGGTPSSSTDQNPSNICYQTPGVFDVTLITTNANGSDTLTLSDFITVYPTPAFPTITQVDYTLTSSLANSYQWQLNATDIPGATNQSYMVVQSGLYTVVITDGNGCVNSANQYVLITGLDEVSNGGISISPNPSTGIFFVEMPGALVTGALSIKVFNSMGQSLYSSKELVTSPNSKKEIDLSPAAPGVYFIEMKSNDFIVRKKITISK